MTSKTTNKFSPEVRTRAVRMVLEHEGEHASRWAAVVSISSKIGCTPQTLHEWVKKAEIDSGWIMADHGSRRIRNARMGRLVQQSPAAGAYRQHPAGRSRGTLLRQGGKNRRGGVTQTK